MLQELRIKDFAIIEDQSIEFGAGLNILTGETGSGKSLILEAFRLVLGGRASTDYFRAGTQGWQIEAILSMSSIDPNIIGLLPEIAQGSDELVISRSMNTNGRSKVLINGNLASLSVLAQVTPYVIALCTQGAQMNLTNSDYLLRLLDEYGGLEKKVQQFKDLYSKFKEKLNLLDTLRQKKAAAVMRQAELEFITSELSALKPTKGMRQSLQSEIHDIKAGREQFVRLKECQDILLSDGGILSLIDKLANLTKKSSSSDNYLEAIYKIRDEVGVLESSISKELKSHDPLDGRLEELQETLSELARLERKFKTDDEGLALLLDSALKEQGQAGGESEQKLTKEVEQLRSDCEKQAMFLSGERKKVAKNLEQLLAKELAELEMKGANLNIMISGTELCLDGFDQIEFMFTPNLGEEARPLRQIASGGELSRVMLILKKLLRDKSGVSILVFDEVDSGISGAVAEAVGRKLKDISDYSQVVCITHLPQVAGFGDRHFLISKEASDRTRTVVLPLSENQRVEEIARMLAGYKVSASARATAKELLSSKDMRLKAVGS